jgi:thymidine phosphorylase
VTAKVRTQEDGDRLARLTEAVAARFGVTVQCLKTDGSQPVGRGIGPALEAHDVLAVLKNQADAPDDLRQRSALIAGAALEMGGKASAGTGAKLALETIRDGRAWSKFQRICEAQGGLRMPPRARCRQALTGPCVGPGRAYQ